MILEHAYMYEYVLSLDCSSLNFKKKNFPLYILQYQYIFDDEFKSYFPIQSMGQKGLFLRKAMCIVSEFFLWKPSQERSRQTKCLWKK